jgi:hypothetical protein
LENQGDGFHRKHESLGSGQPRFDVVVSGAFGSLVLMPVPGSTFRRSTIASSLNFLALTTASSISCVQNDSRVT